MDELSVVLTRPNKSFLFCVLLNERIFPLRFRFAIVEDAIDVGLRSKDANRMDGAAFHRAADMIVDLKKTSRLMAFYLQPPLSEHASILSQLATLYWVIAMDRTAQQNEVIRLYRNAKNQERVARKLEKTQQAVSALLRTASWKHLLSTETLVTDILTGRSLYIGGEEPVRN